MTRTTNLSLISLGERFCASVFKAFSCPYDCRGCLSVRMQQNGEFAMPLLEVAPIFVLSRFERCKCKWRICECYFNSLFWKEFYLSLVDRHFSTCLISVSWFYLCLRQCYLSWSNKVSWPLTNLATVLFLQLTKHTENLKLLQSVVSNPWQCKGSSLHHKTHSSCKNNWIDWRIQRGKTFCQLHWILTSLRKHLPCFFSNPADKGFLQSQSCKVCSNLKPRTAHISRNLNQMPQPKYASLNQTAGISLL